AEVRLRGALDLYGQLSPTDDRRRLEAPVGLAGLVVARDPAEALALAERATALASGSRVTLEVQTDLHEALALALARTGGDGDRARESACFVARALDTGEAAKIRRKRLRAL